MIDSNINILSAGQTTDNISPFGTLIDTILARGSSTWTQDESTIIGRLITQGHRESLKKRLNEVRANISEAETQ